MHADVRPTCFRRTEIRRVVLLPPPTVQGEHDSHFFNGAVCSDGVPNWAHQRNKNIRGVMRNASFKNPFSMLQLLLVTQRCTCRCRFTATQRLGIHNIITILVVDVPTHSVAIGVCEYTVLSNQLPLRFETDGVREDLLVSGYALHAFATRGPRALPACAPSSGLATPTLAHNAPLALDRYHVCVLAANALTLWVVGCSVEGLRVALHAIHVSRLNGLHLLVVSS